jgi:hypothetical protein
MIRPKEAPMRTRLGLLWIAIAAWALSGCTVPDAAMEAQTLERRTASLGEPVGDYPSWHERAVLYLTNRSRTEPDAFHPTDPYPPTAPLRWDHALSQAARFHAARISEDGCWCEDHSSCCALEGQGEGVRCLDGPQACGVTTAGDRVARFSPAFSGENMAHGYASPMAVIDGWTHSPGHWENMNSGHTLLGIGRVGDAWVQDFGSGGSNARTPQDGIHFSDGQQTVFGMTYWQAGTGGPQSIMAIVNGECLPLNLAYGTPELGAFEITKTLDPGCHRYYFFVRDGSGADHVYPSVGSFGAKGAGDAECPFYVQSRPADDCSPAGESCETGHTRPCYTGDFGTQDIGVCQSGVERCVAKQWTGECRGEVGPGQEAAICDGIDDDCDGEVDEECIREEDVATGTEPDMGLMEQEMAPSFDKLQDEGCTIIGLRRDIGFFQVWFIVGLCGLLRRRCVERS